MAIIWNSNQLLAAISLLLIAVWLKRLGRNYVFVIVPMFFVLGTTLYAMFQQVALQWSWFGPEQNNLLFVLGAIIFVFAIWISITALSRSEEHTSELQSRGHL